ncbi:hypothetical protein ACFVJI_31810 [Streptomyces sp. NPDC127584]|uniref:hypothetical protein n=1 Tax=Streptomyces sp. NPDC127584 TaxID=3345403 RepID=UPI00363D5595
MSADAKAALDWDETERAPTLSPLSRSRHRSRRLDLNADDPHATLPDVKRWAA